MFHTRVQLSATPLTSKHHHFQLFSWMPIIVTWRIHPYVVVNHLSSSSSHHYTTLHCGRSNPSPFIMPLAQENSRKKRRFNWTNVSSKPTYAGWATSFPRRAHARISTHNSSLGVWHAIVKETNSTNTNPHVAHAVVCGPRPVQCDGHTMEGHISLDVNQNNNCNCISTQCDVHVIFYGIYVSFHTKCNVHIISLWDPSVIHVSGEFHVKVANLALPAHHCLHGADMSSMCPSLGTCEPN